MKIYVDIDDTIAKSFGINYGSAEPIPERIAKINKLYDEGHTITYWTARGTVTGIDWADITKAQLKSWGCRYHKLKMGKPAFDLFIDDKVINSKEYFN